MEENVKRTRPHTWRDLYDVISLRALYALLRVPFPEEEPVFLEPKPKVTYRAEMHTAKCSVYGCKAFSWADSFPRLQERTQEDGDANVRYSPRVNRYLCRVHWR